MAARTLRLTRGIYRLQLLAEDTGTCRIANHVGLTARTLFLRTNPCSMPGCHGCAYIARLKLRHSREKGDQGRPPGAGGGEPVLNARRRQHTRCEDWV